MLSCFLAAPLAYAGGTQCEHTKGKSEKKTTGQDDEVSPADKAPNKVLPVSDHPQEDNQSWITTLENQSTARQKDLLSKKEDKKDFNYSNYSFLFQLFYKYSLSDFFEAPSFRDEKKNNWQGWTLDLEEQKENAGDWLTHWSHKLYRNLMQ